MGTETERNQRWPRVAFRSGPLASALRARARAGDAATEPEISEIAKRDLGRYYETLGRSLPRQLTEGEWLLLMDVLNGTILEPATIPYVWAEIADALDGNPDLATKWDVAGHALVEKLRRMPYAELAAVADAVERFWLTAPHMDGHTALRAIGVVRDE